MAAEQQQKTLCDVDSRPAAAATPLVLPSHISTGVGYIHGNMPGEIIQSKHTI